MVSEIREITINTFAEYFNILDDLKHAGPYFRGQSHDWPLLPKIARQPNLNGREIIALEKKVFEEFQRRGRPFFGFAPEIKDEIEIITLGQHYGLPTRLLDWTTNPLAALWFAVKDITGNSREKPVVWIFNPADDDDAYRTGYADQDITDIPRTLHFKPFHVDQRLIVQRSVFTIHGSSDPNNERKFIPLENESPKNLTKVVIPPQFSKDLRMKLEQCGIDEAGMFPGLEGLCRQIEKENIIIDIQMSPPDLTNFCTEWLQSWTGNRPDQLLVFYAEDAFYSDPVHPLGLRGHSEICPYFQKLLAKNPDWVWKALEIMPTEKGFTLKWQADIPVKGRVVQVTGLDIVEMRAGKVTRNEVYFDPTSLRV